MKIILLYIALAFSAAAAAQENSIDTDPNAENNQYILYKENAHASYYHDKFNGRKTASGTRFNNDELTAAHKKLPFGTKLRVTNEKNNKCIILVVTDRGPFIKGREIDLSKRAFMNIASNIKSGLVYVKIEIIK
ncbi:septal ring lytic transglycosylase RlpA family protein [Flavobacterium soyae]|uniref:septal ring lytic transglycosylase RlpA family protein n=1 Tax=Flavobacterium soyae TaxID=2903098 RepID=UPI001E57E94E|nr:septal ring lytic transglycosylase RlpA family protein [Flavobacterium soyae]MCD9575375.1 septal ring lytic transglycosylase RlpA family protein [Flavobacterium soyae]